MALCWIRIAWPFPDGISSFEELVLLAPATQLRVSNFRARRADSSKPFHRFTHRLPARSL